MQRKLMTARQIASLDRSGVGSSTSSSGIVVLALAGQPVELRHLTTLPRRQLNRERTL